MKKLTIAIAAIGLFTLCTSTDAQVQQNRLGLTLHGGLDQHMTAFSRIPEEENCCPEFTGGQGTAFGFQALFLRPYQRHSDSISGLDTIRAQLI
jgi:hypothetical protein